MGHRDTILGVLEPIVPHKVGVYGYYGFRDHIRHLTYN